MSSEGSVIVDRIRRKNQRVELEMYQVFGFSHGAVGQFSLSGGALSMQRWGRLGAFGETLSIGLEPSYSAVAQKYFDCSILC